MTPHDLRQDEMRGEEAKRILASQVYNEAYEAVRNKIIEQLELADTTPERRAKLNDLLVAHKKARQYMEQTMMTGKMAQMEIERQATIAQRMVQGIRGVI